MNVKRYYGANMPEIMNKIRHELGLDAVILNSRSVRSQKGLRGLFKKPIMEVMVAYEEEAPRTTASLANSVASPSFAAQLEESARAANPESPMPVLQLRPEDRNPAIRQEREPEKQEITAEETVVPATPEPPMAQPEQAGDPAQEQDDMTRQMREQQQEMQRKLDRMNDMLDHVAQRVESMSVTLPSETTMYIAEMQPLLASLMDAEIHIDLIHAIAQESERILARMTLSPEDVIRRVIRQYLGASLPIQYTPGQRRVVLMLGPTGVGKTTSLVKLAAQYAIRDGRKVGFINADTFRIGAREQISTYAEILDAPLRVVYALDEMSDVLRELQDRDIIFIDTPGKRPSDGKNKDDIQRMVALCNPDDIFLVLSAPTGNRASRELIRHYSYLKDYKLIVTKADETSNAGIVLNACYFSGMPVAYLAWGQNVPDDIAPANLDAIVESILGGGNPW